MAKWISINAEANKFETQVFEFLRDNLPDDYLLFTNLKISRPRGERDCEIDAFLCTPDNGFYVIEVKPGDQPITGKWKGFEKNPIDQAEIAARILVGKLRDWNAALQRSLFINSLVCLTGNSRPNLNNLEEDGNRKKRVLWYQQIPTYVSNHKNNHVLVSNLTYVQKAIESNFNRQYERLGGYQILGEAWKGPLYTAYYARGDSFPYRYLLKVYPIPEHDKDTRITGFLRDLNRELDAIKNIAAEGDPVSGGSKHVIVGETAFKNREEYVIPIQWVSGPALADLMGIDSPFTLDQKCKIAAQICRGVAFAHSAGKGVLHRNLHPGNIIIDRSGNIKIINFDFAKFIDPEIRGQSTTLVGDERALAAWLNEQKQRRQYLAPEVLENRARALEGESPRYINATKETDIFSIGILLWELFTGVLYPDTNGAETVEKALLQSGLPKNIVGDILCMSSADSAQRSIDMISLAKRFEAIAAGPKVFELPQLQKNSTFNNYPILDRLAITDMSVTYLANDRLGEGKVTIKFLKTIDPVKALEETQRVRELSRKLQQSGRCATWVDGGFVDDGKRERVYYQVMEFIEGESLKNVIWKPNHLETDEIIRLSLDVIRCVKAIHEANWTHRDIKPANFILTPDGSVRIIIIDFGLSRRIEEPSHIHAISPGYTPPEVMPQKDGTTKGNWSFQGDVYSTACVIASLFCGEKMDEMNGPAWAESLIESRVPAWKNLLMHDLSEDPAMRSTNASEMLNRYEDALRIDPAQTQLKTEINKQALKQEILDMMSTELAPDSPEMRKATKVIRMLNETGNDESEKIPDLTDLGIRLEDYQIMPDPDQMSSSSTDYSAWLDAEVGATAAATESTDMTDSDILNLSDGMVRTDNDINQADPVEPQMKEMEPVTDANGSDKKTVNNLDPDVKEESNIPANLTETDKLIEIENHHSPSTEENQTSESADTKLLGLRLEERDEMSKLETAIREAELLLRQGRLPDVLVKPLEIARGYFDEIRKRAAQGLTMARTGNVCEAWWAIQVLQETKEKDINQTVLDAVTGDEIPITSALDEAMLEWSNKSAATLTDLKNFKEKYATRPDLVEDHLREMETVTDPDGKGHKISNVLHPDVVLEWNKLVNTIENEKGKYDLAIDERHQGRNALKLPAYFRAYQHFLNARAHYEIIGLDNEIADCYPLAKNEVISNFTSEEFNSRNLANNILNDQKNFTDANESLSIANKYLEEWEQLTHEKLGEQLNRATATKKYITDLQNEFIALQDDIQKVENALNKSTIASDVVTEQEADLNKIKIRVDSQPALQAYFKTRLSTVSGLLSSKKGIEAAKKDARAALLLKMWSSVIIALESHKDKDGEAKELYERAVLEQLIEKIYQHIDARNVPEAFELLQQLPKDVRSGRLKDKNELIENARKQDLHLELYFVNAELKKDSPYVADRCEAYAIFSILSDHKIPPQNNQASTVSYSLSSFTFRSEMAYQDLRAKLQRVLDPLVEKYEAQREIYAPHITTEIWYEPAVALRNVGLLDERQRATACWVEAGFGNVHRKSDLGFWQQLDKPECYPADKYEAVRKGLLYALAFSEISKAEKIVDPKERIIYIQEVQENYSELVGNIDLLICLAKAYADAKDFDGAIKRLNISVTDLPADEMQKVLYEKTRLEIEKIVYETSVRVYALGNKAESEPDTRRAERIWREALSIIGNVLPSTSNDTRLRGLALNTYNAARERLEPEIQQQFEAGENLSGVLYLIDLILLNQLAQSLGIEIGKNVAITEPESKLSDKLNNADFVDEMVAALVDLSKLVDPREQAFEYQDTPATELLKVVEDARETITLVTNYLPQNKHPELGTRLENLAQVRLELRKFIYRPDRWRYRRQWQDTVLHPIGQTVDDWKEAVQGNNFELLEKISKNALQHNRGVLAGIFEGKRFSAKLEDCKRVTDILHQMVAIIRKLYALENFQGVEYLVNWLSNFSLDEQGNIYSEEIPVPWMKPEEISARVSKVIDWEKFDQTNMNEFIRWLKSLTGPSPLPSVPAKFATYELSSEEYRRVYAWRGEKLFIHYLFDGHEQRISGWENLQSDSHRRYENLRVWKELFKHAEKLGDSAFTAYQFAATRCEEKFPWDDGWRTESDIAIKKSALFPNVEFWLPELADRDSRDLEKKFKVFTRTAKPEIFETELSSRKKLPMSYQYWFWENARDRLVQVVVLIASTSVIRNERIISPEKIALEGSRFSMESILSNSASRIKSDLEKVFIVYQSNLSVAQKHLSVLEAYGTFPTEKELAKALKENRSKFKELMEKAREIGPTSKSESRIYWVFKLELETKTFWQTLLGR